MPVRWRIVATVVLLELPDIHAEVAEEGEDTVAASTIAIERMGTMTIAIGRTQDPGLDPEAEADLAVVGRAAVVAEAARVVVDAAVVEAAADLAAVAVEAGRVLAADGRAVEAPDPTPSPRNPSRCPNRHPNI